MLIGVYGAGYLGTVISSCLADFGSPVTCFDEDAPRVAALEKGELPYFEPNLRDALRRNMRAGRLTYSGDIQSFASRSSIIFVAQDSSNYVESIAVRIGKLGHEPLIVNASPSPVGTGHRIEQALKAAGSKAGLISHPLFLTDGCALEDFNWPDRILLGGSSSSAVMTMKQIYRPLVMRGVPVIVTSHETAELVRESATAFYATKISFINELAALCEHVNADAVDLALALGLDKKIAPRCLQPGAAFGGPLAEAHLDSLGQLARGAGVELKILGAAREVNRSFSSNMADKIARAVQSLTDKQLGVLGLAFKPNTNSVAGSSSMMLVRSLTRRGAAVRAYDPAANPAAKLELEGTVRFCDDAYLAADGSDALVVGTAWPEFRALDFKRIRKLLKTPMIIDTKNLLDSGSLRNLGFQYVGMGRA
ncbi:MAG: nucleotide sugar dehydrogenase [Terriglobales bacterium]|jgi:UDPglucose 6-dehydrogenase